MGSKYVEVDGVWQEQPGHAALWLWFGCSHASWLTMPRVLMHEMPDEWQLRMAKLLEEYDEHWELPDCGVTTVALKQGGKFRAMPGWIRKGYRHPDTKAIEGFKRPQLLAERDDFTPP